MRYSKTYTDYCLLKLFTEILFYHNSIARIDRYPFSIHKLENYRIKRKQIVYMYGLWSTFIYDHHHNWNFKYSVILWFIFLLSSVYGRNIEQGVLEISRIISFFPFILFPANLQHQNDTTSIQQFSQFIISAFFCYYFSFTYLIIWLFFLLILYTCL